MSASSASKQERQKTEMEAAKWITLMDSGTMSESERRELHTWLCDDGRNARAMSEYRSMLSILQDLPDEKKELLRAMAAPQESVDRPVPKIALPPGYYLAAILRLLLTPTAFNRYVYPAISDMQAQYNEAIAAGKKRMARWIAIRQQLSILISWNLPYALVIREIIKFLERFRW